MSVDILYGMDDIKTYRDVLTPIITEMSQGTMRIVYSMGEQEMAVLYFERPKKGWKNKPIMPRNWQCWDAKITDKAIYINGLVEPKDLIQWGMELLNGGINYPLSLEDEEQE